MIEMLLSQESGGCGGRDAYHHHIHHHHHHHHRHHHHHHHYFEDISDLDDNDVHGYCGMYWNFWMRLLIVK